MNRFFFVSPSALYCSLALILLALFPSCHRLDERMEIKETRPISTYAAKPVTQVISSKDRFADAEPPAEESEAPPQKLFAWTTPEGWQDAGPDAAGMRYINLQFGPKGEGECYLSLLPGTGGILANVNRWRTQMGLPPITTEEADKLPKKPLLNREATFVSLDGDFKGFGATEAAKGYRLVGLILAAPQAILTVKMTGPKDLLEKNMPAFEQFIQSISPAR
jgi:hypothetical protein